LPLLEVDFSGVWLENVLPGSGEFRKAGQRSAFPDFDTVIRHHDPGQAQIAVSGQQKDSVGHTKQCVPIRQGGQISWEDPTPPDIIFISFLVRGLPTLIRPFMLDSLIDE
jgi:hypothetical protein